MHVILTDIAIPAKAKRVGWLKDDRLVEFTIVLSPRSGVPAADNTRPAAHLTHAELRKMHGAAAHSVEMIEAFARLFAIDIMETAPRRRSMRLRGRAGNVARAFKTRFGEFEQDGARFFAPVRPPRTPVEWKGRVEVVLGLHSSRRSSPRRSSMAHAPGALLQVAQLARQYAFPTKMDGAGETIGLIEFGGGFRKQDIEEFCAKMGVASPRITVVKIGSGANRPASQQAIHKLLDFASGASKLSSRDEASDSFASAQCTVEVTMDLEILAALAPKAHIVVYFASTDGQDLYHAISRAVHDERRRPSVLSISWGVPEASIPEGEIHAIEGVLREAAHLGITVCASSGDDGALNGSKNGTPSVNYPASSPHCLACGGTSRKLNARGKPEEVVWNSTHYGIKGASGGGISERFQVPAWQKEARLPAGPSGRSGRGLPDVAGLADPRHGCELLIAGRVFASAGTSAVAPMWAALVARLNQALGHRCGHLHAPLYSVGKQRLTGKEDRIGLHPVTRGNNGFYRAGKGWNACAGYGTPRGSDLLKSLRAGMRTAIYPTSLSSRPNPERAQHREG